jgi:RNA polymerase sigma factor (sigma-70 family)
MKMDVNIELIKQGDPDQWETFFPHLWKYLMSVALGGKLYSEHDDVEQYCEDLVSDAIERGVRSIDSSYANSYQQLLGYFRKILFNVAYSKFDLLRSRTGHDRPEDWQTINLLIDNEGEMAASFSEVLKEINQLPEGMHQVLWMYGYEGFSHVEIGEQLGISTSTSKSQFLRARKKVIEKLSA